MGRGGGLCSVYLLFPFYFNCFTFSFFSLSFSSTRPLTLPVIQFFFLLARYIYFLKKITQWLQLSTIPRQYPLKTFCFVESLSSSNLRSFACRLGRQADQVPVLYHYPRLCIIRPDDHQHAAFYPPVEELQALGTRVQTRLDQINSQQIIKFAKDYMKDPAIAVVKTEYF